MTRNIREVLESRPDVTELLAIVGTDHVDGMKQQLLQSGYSSMPVPTVNQMKMQDAVDQVVPVSIQ